MKAMFLLLLLAINGTLLAQLPTKGLVTLYSLPNHFNSEITSHSLAVGITPFHTVGADTTPPPAPISLTGTPSGWTPINSFSINWTNPSDSSGIVAAWYKLGSTPGFSTDGIQQTGKPFSVSASTEGGQMIHLWLEDGAGNKDHEKRSTTTLYHDCTAPTGGTIAINNGAASTSSLVVTLNSLGASDYGGSGLSLMCFSNNNVCWSPWESYTDTRSGWDLTQYGGNAALERKTVYAMYRDAVGMVSSVVSDNIVYGPQPPWKFANTGISHSIIIPTAANPGISGAALSAGDYVGVFYDSLGTLVCAGYEGWTGRSSIAVFAFGDDPNSVAKDGLSPGEIFRWKIFHASEGNVYDAEATYSAIGGAITHANTYATNGISQLTSLIGGLSTHSMVLRSGWSLISSYVVPQSAALDNIFASALTDLIILKNGAQKSYIPSVPVNSIGSWVPTEGYQIKMSKARTVGFRGQKIVPSTLKIGLPLGWSIMPYVRDSEMSIASALSGVVSDVVMVKDQDGKTYIPSVGVDGIGTLKVGQAYQIKTAVVRSMEYPASAASATSAATRAKQSVAGPTWFFSNTGTSHTFIISTGVNPAIDGAPLVAGDVIGMFYDSSGTPACAGYEVWSGTSNIAIAAFGDDATTPAKDGLASGEVLKWKIWRQSDAHVFVARATYRSPGAMGGIVTDTSQYNTNGISAISTLSGSITSVNGQQLPTEFVLMQNYPNPFNPSTRIAYGLAGNVHVKITVMNMLGQEIATLVSGNQEAGYYEVIFDGGKLASGVYLYRMQARSYVEMRKLLLVRCLARRRRCVSKGLGIHHRAPLVSARPGCV